MNPDWLHFLVPTELEANTYSIAVCPVEHLCYVWRRTTTRSYGGVSVCAQDYNLIWRSTSFVCLLVHPWWRCCRNDFIAGRERPFTSHSSLTGLIRLNSGHINREVHVWEESSVAAEQNCSAAKRGQKMALEFWMRNLVLRKTTRWLLAVAFISCGYTYLLPEVSQWVIGLGWDQLGFPVRWYFPVTLQIITQGQLLTW